MAFDNGRKKLLLSIIVVGISATMLSAGTFAYFSSTQSTPNLFTTGTIAMTVDGQDPWTTSFNTSLTDLKPSMTGWGNVTLENSGTNPMDVWVEITDVATGAGTTPNSELGEDPSDSINDIDGVIRYDLLVGGSSVIADTDDYTISAGTHQLVGDTTAMKDSYIWLGNIAPAGTLTVNQSFMMDGPTTNWAQGDTMTFVVKFYAQQSQGTPQPAAPTPELTNHERP